MTGYKMNIPERMSVSEVKIGRGSWTPVFWSKEERDHPACYQCTVQKSASVMVWGYISHLQICEGTINVEQYIQVLEQHMQPSKQLMFQGRSFQFQQDNTKAHSAHITTAWLLSKRVWVLNWSACSPDLPPTENISHIMKRKNDKGDPNC
uniref:Transposable element Tcb1 transposase n=1 Tax=Esox lucius TaxID=8010 RepID=C1BWD9_ESOLU|nr:Transposable element Tcb1 transposase [Esox lucius]